MSNLAKLKGIGQKFLINNNGEIVAEFIDGNFSSSEFTGDEEEAEGHETGCGCTFCGYEMNDNWEE